MTKLTARTLGKVGLLLVAIGYFMPIASGTSMNVFAVVSNLSEISSWLGIDLGFYIFLVYLIFISSVVGGILLILQYSGKPISIKFEWAAVIAAIISFIILLIRIYSALNELMESISDSYFGVEDVSGNILEYVGFGGYLIVIGLFASFLFMLIASDSKEESVVNKEKQIYIIKTGIEIKSRPEHNAYTKQTVNAGVKIFFENIFNNDPTWSYVKTLDSKCEGWCLSDHLEKV